MNRRDAGNRVIGASGHRVIEKRGVRNVLVSGLSVLRAAIREIFDESAYARFLERNALTSSGAAYAAFLREKSGGRPRPRCC